uniref:Uncharacterized protein n=1 Tax=Plectus sambesii TaxID=2011161 RepID=A0A914V4I6_9BILA
MRGRKADARSRRVPGGCNGWSVTRADGFLRAALLRALSAEERKWAAMLTETARLLHGRTDRLCDLGAVAAGTLDVRINICAGVFRDDCLGHTGSVGESWRLSGFAADGERRRGQAASTVLLRCCAKRKRLLETGPAPAICRRARTAAVVDAGRRL